MQKLGIKWAIPAFNDFMIYINYYKFEAGLSVSSRFADEVKKALDLLSEMPNISRPGRKISTREYIVKNFPFIIEFRVRSNRLEILAFLHQARITNS